MPMPVVQVRIVRMLVPHRRVVVPMGVRLAGRIARAVGVLMVFVMRVPVIVVEGRMDVRMIVPLG